MKILIADDDLALSESLKFWLESEKFLVDSAKDGAETLGYLEATNYDLIILDWMMPIFTGIEVCKRYRQTGGKAYIIMLTGQNKTDEKVQGLDTGADDYLTKPFEMYELLSRIKALLRRPLSEASDMWKVGDLLVNKNTKEICYGVKTTKLMPFEYWLFNYLVQHPKQVFTVEFLRDKLSENSEEAALSSVYSSFSRLKHKLKSIGAADVIKSIRGSGYFYEPN